MPVQVKICGLSTAETVDAAIAGGASHIGLVFFPKSPRNVHPEAAAALASRAAGRVKTVGLFVDPEPGFVEAMQSQVGFEIVQLHGHESAEAAARLKGEVWKAIPVRTSADLGAAAGYGGLVTRILYDAMPPTGAPLPGGTGLRFDWALLERFAHPLPWVLAGGLDADNVAEAVAVTRARLVDVSSGVEDSPGVKSVAKIAAFLKATAQL